jgi:hypothetical protein
MRVLALGLSGEVALMWGLREGIYKVGTDMLSGADLRISRSMVRGSRLLRGTCRRNVSKALEVEMCEQPLKVALR